MAPVVFVKLWTGCFGLAAATLNYVVLFAGVIGRVVPFFASFTHTNNSRLNFSKYTFYYNFLNILITAKNFVLCCLLWYSIVPIFRNSSKCNLLPFIVYEYLFKEAKFDYKESKVTILTHPLSVLNYLQTSFKTFSFWSIDLIATSMIILVCHFALSHRK